MTSVLLALSHIRAFRIDQDAELSFQKLNNIFNMSSSAEKSVATLGVL
jgi:hypothetical protein